MTGYVLSPRAQADLAEIWDYSVTRWGEDRAERYIRDLWSGIRTIADDPRRGQSCDEIILRRDQARVFQVSSSLAHPVL